jgi:hypothetical protein
MRSKHDGGTRLAKRNTRNCRLHLCDKKTCRSQVLLKEVERLEQAVTLTNKDIQQLRLAGDVLEDRTGKF